MISLSSTLILSGAQSLPLLRSNSNPQVQQAPLTEASQLRLDMKMQATSSSTEKTLQSLQRIIATDDGVKFEFGNFASLSSILALDIQQNDAYPAEAVEADMFTSYVNYIVMNIHDDATCSHSMFQFGFLVDTCIKESEKSSFILRTNRKNALIEEKYSNPYCDGIAVSGIDIFKRESHVIGECHDSITFEYHENFPDLPVGLLHTLSEMDVCSEVPPHLFQWQRGNECNYGMYVDTENLHGEHGYVYFFYDTLCNHFESSIEIRDTECFLDSYYSYDEQLLPYALAQDCIH